MGSRSLTTARSTDIDALMPWFTDEVGATSWGGPQFRYPFTRESFHEDCHWHDMDTFVLRDATGLLVGFGQLYERSNRIHLARIGVCPERRGCGIGRELVRALLDEGRRIFELPEYSLFVRKDNPVASKLYSGMGFIRSEFPPGAPMQDICYYMIRQVEERQSPGG